MSLLDELGLDRDDVSWEDLASCKNMEWGSFFEEYENDQFVAKEVDQLCLSCPVISECLSVGISEKRWGVWGGVYLTEGSIDVKLNKHKAENDWNVWKERANTASSS